MDSEEVSIVLASVPDKPSSAPYQDLTFSNTEYWIKENYASIPTLNNGGSGILSYQLWRDNGIGGNFNALYEDDINMALSFIDQNVNPGLTY